MVPHSSDRAATEVGLRREVDRLRFELETLKRREESARAVIGRFHAELHLVSQLQHDLLPSSLPTVPDLRIETLYRPVGRVGGDLFDVVRLDQTRIGIALWDATGHGMTAALVATLARRSLHGALGLREWGHVLDPDEVLNRLNSDLLARPMEDCHFVAALYAMYDETAGVIRWARAGAPYPILIRDGQDPLQVKSQGSLAGIDEETEYEVVELEIQPDDRILFHTDGVDALLSEPVSKNGHCNLPETNWFHQLGSQPNSHILRDLEGRMDRIGADSTRADDVTVVALQRRADIAADSGIVPNEESPAGVR